MSEQNKPIPIKNLFYMLCYAWDVLAIKDEVKIPVKYIGLGEGYNDLKSFDIEAYIYGLFKDLGDKYDEK